MSEHQNLSPAVGIDLGTTFSVIAHLNQEGNPKTILNEEGELTTPSAVFFETDSVIVGREAMRAGQFEPQRLAAFAKRDIGEGTFHKSIHGATFPPEVIQALVLKKLKEDAQIRLGKITQAVITVPAYFNEPRRKATQDAGRLAGLQVLDIINEPTAAAIAYGYQSGFIAPDATSAQQETILVYDLGGGTFDVTLMEIDGKNYNTLATGGDVHLGGIDWDQRVVDHIAQAFEKEHGYDPRELPELGEMLFHEASEAKRSLTARNQARVQIVHEGKQSRIAMTRKEFETMSADLLERTRMTVRRVLKEGNTEWKDVTRLLLVGGSTRMPMVTKMLETESGKQVDRSLSPDEAVAHGAAIYAGTFLNQPAAHPDRVAVANVNSHDLGVLGMRSDGSQQRRMMIPRNTVLPAEHVSKFVTAKDGQKNISIRVVEGGTETGEGSNEIGKCIVTDLPPDLPARTAVEVTFQYQSDGRLVVGASVPSTGAEAEMTIKRASGFDDEQIEEWKARIEAGLSVAEPDPNAEPAQEEPASKPESIVEEEEGGFVLDESPDDDGPEISGFVLDTDPPKDAPAKEAVVKQKAAVKQKAVEKKKAGKRGVKKPLPRMEKAVAKGKSKSTKPADDADENLFDEIFDSDDKKPKVESGDSDLDDFLKGLS